MLPPKPSELYSPAEWAASIAEAQRLSKPIGTVPPEVLATMRQAQDRADADGVPVRVVWRMMVDQEQVAVAEHWVLPLATQGRWLVVGGRPVLVPEREQEVRS